MIKRIAVLSGDGIGPEVVSEALKVLDAIQNKYGYEFKLTEGKLGGVAIDTYGVSLPPVTVDLCRDSEAVLVGAVGGPKWDAECIDNRPEVGLLKLRSELELFANLRHGKMYTPLRSVSPLKDEQFGKCVDIMMVRELTGGIYFGEKGNYHSDNQEVAYDVEKYSDSEIRRIADVAFKLASIRNKKVISIDKANILESSKLWRRIVEEKATEYPDVELGHMYADNAAMQLIKKPNAFDVVVTANLFGDILSDEMSMIIGSIGLIPSASLGESTLGIYEPIHGSAPYMTNRDIANPIATILSLSLMLKYSFKMHEACKDIEMAIESVLNQGYRTKDTFRENDQILVGTKDMGTLIYNTILNAK